MKYNILREYDSDCYTGVIEELPGCITTGKTIEEFQSKIELAKKLYFESCLERGESIPEPSDLSHRKDKRNYKSSTRVPLYGWIQEHIDE